MERPVPHIEVQAHGPYEVTGDIPIRPRRVVRTQAGEAVTWTFDDELEHPATYYLCRCGQSRNKPFCDGSHAFELFEGTETAPTSTYDERAERHEGPEVVVSVDPQMCHHSRFCKYELTNYFETIPQAGDIEKLSMLVGMVERCPSGALSIEVNGSVVEPLLHQQISPVENGPLLVSGAIEVSRADDEPMEVRHRVALCRCGDSANKPLCDGSHLSNGFEA